MSMKNAWGHLCTITEHKILVMRGCFRLGLYRQGLMHDLSKYTWTEFRVGMKYYQGTRSPNNAEREDIGYSSAWLHHKGRNKHHFEYWIDYSLEKDEILTGMRMPEKYVAEMFVDRISASKIYQKEKYTDLQPLEYFRKGTASEIIHEETRTLLEKLLVMLAQQGEDAAFDYIKKEVLKKKY